MILLVCLFCLDFNIFASLRTSALGSTLILLAFYIYVGSLPSELGRMSSLKLLGLHNNRLESVIPIELWNLTKLSALYLDGNGFRGAISTEVNNLKELVDFRLRNNHMDGPLPNALGDLSKSVK